MQQELARLGHILKVLGTFDLVVVDEGHYEPAPSRSRSVRSLGRPTLLLSATPFRNDYKLFSVRGAYAYNFPFPRAADAKIVREVAFADLATQDDSTLRDTDQALTAADQTAIESFADRLLQFAPLLLEGKPDGSKIIVRAASWSALAALQPRLAGNELLPVLRTPS